MQGRKELICFVLCRELFVWIYCILNIYMIVKWNVEQKGFILDIDLQFRRKDEVGYIYLGDNVDV